MQSNEPENWKPIPNWEDRYEVSDRGNVRSVGHTDSQGHFHEPAEMAHSEDARGYRRVTLSRDGTRKAFGVHRLMALAFLPNPKGYPVVRHWDDDKSNNRLSNLLWGTHKDNAADSIRNGTNDALNRTHCPKGHEYTPENTIVRPGTSHRKCRECDRAFSREKFQGRKARVRLERFACICGKEVMRKNKARHESTCRAALEAAFKEMGKSNG